MAGAHGLSPYFWRVPPLYFEFSPTSGVRSGRVVKVYPSGDWSESRLGVFELDEAQVFNVPDDLTSVGSVVAITDNPKARRITYTVKLEIIDPGIFFIRHNAQWEKKDQYTVSSEVAKAVKRYLYEFNDKHSKELAKFYNPLDEKQVKELTELLLPWLNPQIEKEGLHAPSLSFEVD